MKTSISSVILLTLFALCAHGGEVERFIRETLAEQRARSATESSKVGKIIDDAINDSNMPELELPKESVFTSKDKERDARYYKYDKTGKLISVEYAAKPEKNEYYAYDRQGNIIEKRMGDKVYKYTYDTGNQLKEMSSPEGKREYFYDRAGRLIIEKFNGEIDVEYKYGYLDKVVEVNRKGKTTKFAYDGFGMLSQKTFHDGTTEVWVWDGLALIRRGSDIHVNEPHISGGVPIVSKTPNGTQFHESDFLGTTLWSIDTKGNVVSFQNDTIFGDGTIKTNRCARFTGKPYDGDLQAFLFPFRNYDEKTARWRSSDPIGFPDGINQHFYAAVPTTSFDILGLKIEYEGGREEYIRDLLNKLVDNDILGYGSLTAKEIIDKLENSKHAHKIILGNENKTSPTDTQNISNPEKGSGSTITINPGDEWTNPNGGGWQRPVELALMHELIHSTQFNEGRFDNTREGGIERSEIEACRETNRVLLEGKANGFVGVQDISVRTSSSGVRLPDSAINPTPRTK